MSFAHCRAGNPLPCPVLCQVLQQLVCWPLSHPLDAGISGLENGLKNKEETQKSGVTPRGSHPLLWATRVSLSHISSPYTGENGVGGAGRERKERGKEGSVQTTALLSLTSQHSLEGPLLNFRWKANIHREVGNLSGQVHGTQRLIWGQDTGPSVMKTPRSWSWAARPHHATVQSEIPNQHPGILPLKEVRPDVRQK